MKRIIKQTFTVFVMLMAFESSAQTIIDKYLREVKDLLVEDGFEDILYLPIIEEISFERNHEFYSLRAISNKNNSKIMTLLFKHYYITKRYDTICTKHADALTRLQYNVICLDNDLFKEIRIGTGFESNNSDLNAEKTMTFIYDNMEINSTLQEAYKWYVLAYESCLEEQDKNQNTNPPKESKPTKPIDNQVQQTKKDKPSNEAPPPGTVKYNFHSTPDYASIYVDGSYVGMASTSKALVPGTYTIKATKRHCKPFEKQMLLTDYNTDIHIRLKQLLNRKFEFYIEGNYCTMALPSAGATIGGYLGNFNMEASYYLPFDKSEDIYWCDDINMPYKTIYTPDIAASAKIGWGIPVGTRLRITPQAGANFCSLKEDNDGNKEDKTFANQANVIDIIGSVRFSFAVVKHLCISVTPEYLYMFKTSEGYEVLKDVSPKIQDWSDGLNLKLGLVLFF